MAGGGPGPNPAGGGAGLGAPGRLSPSGRSRLDSLTTRIYRQRKCGFVIGPHRPRCHRRSLALRRCRALAARSRRDTVTWQARPQCWPGRPGGPPCPGLRRALPGVGHRAQAQSDSWKVSTKTQRAAGAAPLWARRGVGRLKVQRAAYTMHQLHPASRLHNPSNFYKTSSASLIFHICFRKYFYSGQ